MNRDPIETSFTELKTTDFTRLRAGDSLQILESNFPECLITRKGKAVNCAISEHIYTKYWMHKFHAMVFAEAMVRAVRRFTSERHPLSNPSIENDDEPHIFISWNLSLPAATPGDRLISAVRDCWDSVWQRANNILEDSESVLVLGKDTGPGMKRLKTIASVLENSGHYVYIIKDQPDRLGESVIQKVLRYALLSRFVVIENTEPSGHLYEVPHVAKMAECITAVLQEKGKGSTWMLEDAYGKFKAWKKFSYTSRDLASVVTRAANWAHRELNAFGDYQRQVLPWMKKK
ncbi:MAG: hypothetical protein ACYDH9_14200 [Limisphaerales bacterium]